METQVSKWGNSLAIRLPVEVLKKTGLVAGDRVSLTASPDGSVTIKPKRPKYELSALVEGIKPENLHSETDWGIPEGDEVW